MNKNDCKIVKDLLPNYVDGLTSKESSEFLENHIKECNECSEILENMKKDFENEKEISKKNINIAKKYNKKIKSLILIIIILLVVIIFGNFIRNVIILKSLGRKAEKYEINENNSNYHLTWTTYSKEQTTIFDVYYKDGKYKQIVTNFDYEYYRDYGENVTNTEMYYDGTNFYQIFKNEKKIYKETYDKKEGKEGFFIRLSSMNHSTVLDEDLLRFLIVCSLSKITSEKCNGVECYRLSGILNGVNTLYIDKETGISARSESGISSNNIYSDVFSDVTVEFDTVTEEDVKLPNTEGYEIVNQ